MIRLWMLLWLALVGSVAHASPHLPGVRQGVEGASIELGTPAAPPPTPGPSPLVIGPTAPSAWTTPTTVPAAQGNPAEPVYSLNAIAQWDQPPFMPMTVANNQVCVDAHHAPTPTEHAGGISDNIESVEFIANNGTPVVVTSTEPSSRSFYYGTSDPMDMWCTNLELSGVPNNTIVEVRAVVRPLTGQSVVLQGSAANPYFTNFWSLFIVANYTPTRYYVAASGGSNSNNCTSDSTPCANLSGVKAKVGSGDYQFVEACLLAGTHSLSAGTTTSTATNGYFIIKPCPGLTKADVTINGWGSGVRGPYVTKFMVEDVTVTGDLTNTSTIGTVSGGWLVLKNVQWNTAAGCYDNGGTRSDDCYIIAPGYSFGNNKVWILDSSFTEGRDLTAGQMMVRNTVIDRVNADFAQNTKVILGGRVKTIDTCCGVHPDVVQSSNASSRNKIVRGLRANEYCDCQLLFASHSASDNQPLIDVAFVDLLLDNNQGPWERMGWDFGPPTANGVNLNVFTLRLNMTTRFTTWRSQSTMQGWNIVDSTCTITNIGPKTGVTFLNSPTCD